ncbi:MAG: response regulator [Deltaproteobacteria bacterium]|nr:response regulator [Deltaproteobacteria bacterium]
MRCYLIIDDNLQLAENLAEIISDAGAEAVAVDGLDAALAQVKAQRFDALLTDMRMPVANGAEVVHRVRQLDPDLPACVMTAYTADDDLASARREGLLAIFAKPVPIGPVLATLEAAKRGGLVALVEDDPALSDNLCELLRGQGFGVVTAASVVETDRLGPVRPFAALMDVRVPGGPDGEALRRFAARFPDVPRLVITAHRDMMPAVPHAGVFGKPFDSAALLQEIDQLYARARSAA